MAESIPNACGAFEFIYLSQFIPATFEHGVITHLTLTEDHGLCGGQGRRRRKCFLASSNLKHLWLSGAMKRIWLKQKLDRIKVQAQIYSFWKQLLSPLAPFLPLALSLMSLSSLSMALFFVFFSLIRVAVILLWQSSRTTSSPPSVTAASSLIDGRNHGHLGVEGGLRAT